MLGTSNQHGKRAATRSRRRAHERPGHPPRHRRPQLDGLQPVRWCGSYRYPTAPRTLFTSGTAATSTSPIRIADATQYRHHA